MNNRETKKAYEAPALTVVSFKTERGYSASVKEESKGIGVSNYTEENGGSYYNW